MPKKKSATKKKLAKKKKATSRKLTVARKSKGKKKSAPKAPKRRVIRREISSGAESSSLGSGIMRGARERPRRGLGEEAGGQSGDLQGLSEVEDSNAESVEELLEEGQSFEAEVIDAVEHTPDADQGEVRTHERPESEISPDEGEQ
jgi:hypothetical protein